MAGTPQHATLVANTVTTLQFDLDWNAVEVTNVDGAALIYFTLDGTDPVIAATGTFVVTAGAGAFVEAQPPTNLNTAVKLIAPAAVKVSVRAW